MEIRDFLYNYTKIFFSEAVIDKVERVAVIGRAHWGGGKNKGISHG